jgi:tRNA(Ile)-lysidine synthase TilS/MesJ
MIKLYALYCFFSREEIANYANENDIKWREDSSNASDKYLRNKIRHDLVPLLKELNPYFIVSKNTILFTGITNHG